MRTFTMLRAIGLAIVLVAPLAVGRVAAQSQDDAAKSFVGMWRLVSITTNGQVNLDRGPRPTGFIVYDKSGSMAAQIMPDRERPKFAAGQPTGEEAQAAMRGYIAYFGTYKVDPAAKTVTHYRKGNIVPGAAQEIVRRFEFVGEDRVILRPVENQYELTWERVK